MLDGIEYVSVLVLLSAKQNGYQFWRLWWSSRMEPDDPTFERWDEIVDIVVIGFRM